MRRMESTQERERSGTGYPKLVSSTLTSQPVVSSDTPNTTIAPATNPADSASPAKYRKLSDCAYQPSRGCMCTQTFGYCGCGDNDNDETTQRRLACPFFRRDPTRQPPSTSCKYPGFPSISRVKEHIYRKHKAAGIRCSRCHEVFTTEQSLEEHQRSQEACEVRQQPKAEDLNKDQEKALKSRKRTQEGVTMEEKWYEVYRILFPEDSIMPTPYVENEKTPVGEFAQYQDFSRHKFREVLACRLGHLESNQKGKLIDTILACQEFVFQDFKRDHGIEKPSTPPSSVDLDDKVANIGIEPYWPADIGCLEEPNNIIFSDSDTESKTLSSSSADVTLPECNNFSEGWTYLPSVAHLELLPDLASKPFGENADVNGCGFLSDFSMDPFSQDWMFSLDTPKALVEPKEELEDGIPNEHLGLSGNQSTMELRPSLSRTGSLIHCGEAICDDIPPFK